MPLKAFLKHRFPATWNRLRATRKLIALVSRAYGFEARDCVMCGYRGKFLAEILFPTFLPMIRYVRVADRCRATACSDWRSWPKAGLYRSADLYAKDVDLRLNIEAIDQPDASWDLIICSHVLEHIDHRKAIKELHRILAPGGVLLALFPYRGRLAP